jgi:formate C-acetyltransferase
MTQARPKKLTKEHEMAGAGHQPSTPRTRRLKETLVGEKYTICADRAVMVTESFKQTEGMHPAIRQALALDKVLSEMPIWIRDGELIAGNVASRPNGANIFPEYDCKWMAHELDTISTRAGDRYVLPSEDREQLAECFTYWRGKTLLHLADALSPDEAKKAEAIPALHAKFSRVGGLGHLIPDHRRVVREGLGAMLREAEEQLSSLDLTDPSDFAKWHFLKAVIMADTAVLKWAKRFADLAREKSREETDPERKSELEAIAQTCDWVPANPARTFREVLQAVTLIMDSIQIESNGVSIGVGRLDQLCLPYYERDLRGGVLTREQATELLECLWLKLAEVNRVGEEIYSYMGGYQLWIHVTLGGQTADGDDATNALSYLMLDVTGNMKLPKPTVSARVHKRTPEEFLIRCCEIIKAHGGGMPALLNDEVVIASRLAYEPGITKEDAYDWSIIGCVEPGIEGKGSPAHLGSVLIGGTLVGMTLFGKDPFTGIQLVPEPSDMLAWKSNDDMIAAFSEQVRHYTRAMVMATIPTDAAHIKYLPTPFLSSLVSDCVKRGRTVWDGGAIYDGGPVFCYIGVPNIGNSLAAIKKLVFDDKVLTMAQLKHALETDFEDTTTDPTGPEIRQLCLAAPKFGNDDDYVDRITKDCFNIMVKELRGYTTLTGGKYRAVIAPTTAHIQGALACGATPDGRKAGAPLADACSPAQGTDLAGPTAAVQSVAKIEHINCACGSVYNMRLHPATVQDRAGMAKWSHLIRTYFDLGGWELQFNTVDAETLRQAQKHPEQYRDLLIRVVGYSAHFVQLDKAIQDDIISRTEHALS